MNPHGTLDAYDGGCRCTPCQRAYVDALPDNAAMSATQAALWLRMDRATFRRNVNAGKITPWLPGDSDSRSYYTKRTIDAEQLGAAS